MGEDVYKSLDNDPNAPAYGNRLLKVKSLKVKVASSPNPITGVQAEAKLEVVMRRESTAYTGQKTVTKKFPITLELDASKQLTGCVSDVSAIADPVKKEVCLELGGNWGGSPEKCTYERICPQGEYLESFGKAGKVCKTSPKIADKTCPAGEAVTKFVNGVPVCGAVSGTTTQTSQPQQTAPVTQWTLIKAKKRIHVKMGASISQQDYLAKVDRLRGLTVCSGNHACCGIRRPSRFGPADWKKIHALNCVGGLECIPRNIQESLPGACTWYDSFAGTTYSSNGRTEADIWCRCK